MLNLLRVRPTKLVKGHHPFTFTFITSHQSSFALNVREHGLSDHVPKSTSEFQGRAGMLLGCNLEFMGKFSPTPLT